MGLELELLKKSYKNNRLAHFYIFNGEKNELKLKTALEFMTLFYDEVDFNNILKMNHLNLFYIKPEGKNIKKEQITNLLDEFDKTSLVKGPRFYIIDEAEKLNIQSSNSLLKFLEETPLDVYGILITDNLEQLPVTIISRAQIINFRGTKKNVIESKINNKYASIISSYTNILDEAISLSKDNEFLKKIDYCMELMENRAISKNSLYQFYINNKISSLDDFMIVVKLLIIYYSDILKYMNNDLNIAFKEFDENIKTLKNKFEKKDIYKIIKELEDALYIAAYNVKIDSLMNKIILDM